MAPCLLTFACVFIGTLFERTLLNSGAVLVLCCRPRSLHPLSLSQHSPILPSASFLSPILQPKLQALSSPLSWMRNGGCQLFVCVCVCPQKANSRNTKISLAAFDLSPCVVLPFIVWLAHLVHVSCLNTDTGGDCCYCCLYVIDAHTKTLEQRKISCASGVKMTLEY